MNTISATTITIPLLFWPKRANLVTVSVFECIRIFVFHFFSIGTAVAICIFLNFCRGDLHIYFNSAVATCIWIFYLGYYETRSFCRWTWSTWTPNASSGVAINRRGRRCNWWFNTGSAPWFGGGVWMARGMGMGRTVSSRYSKKRHVDVQRYAKGIAEGRCERGQLSWHY